MLAELDLINITKYLIQFYAALKVTYGDEDNSQIIVNEEKKSFELRVIEGYFQPELITLIHIEINNGLLWIHNDATDDFIAFRLEDMGVPKEQIVLGFLSEEERRHTDYASGV